MSKEQNLRWESFAKEMEARSEDWEWSYEWLTKMVNGQKKTMLGVRRRNTHSQTERLARLHIYKGL